MADRVDGRPAAPTESTIRDWDDEDPSGQTYRRVLFVDSDLTEVENRGGVFEECTFRGVRFNASTHTDAAFVNCTFVRCSLFDTTFTGCKLVGSFFDDCTYNLLKVSGGDWSFTGLPGADLRGSDLSTLDPRTVTLKDARIDVTQAMVVAAALGLDVRP